VAALAERAVAGHLGADRRQEQHDQEHAVWPAPATARPDDVR
jgi:hypothetical protein